MVVWQPVAEGRSSGRARLFKLARAFDSVTLGGPWPLSSLDVPQPDARKTFLVDQAQSLRRQCATVLFSAGEVRDAAAGFDEGFQGVG